MFSYFMDGYWNQMSPDIYKDFRDAVTDFKNTEGKERFFILCEELSRLVKIGRIPSMSGLEAAHKDKFWENFGMILTIEDIYLCKDVVRIE